MSNKNPSSGHKLPRTRCQILPSTHPVDSTPLSFFPRSLSYVAQVGSTTMDHLSATSSPFPGPHSANGTAPPLPAFLTTIPSFASLHALLPPWIPLDITLLAATFTILSTLLGVLPHLRALATSTHQYTTRFFTASISIDAHDQLNREVLRWVGARVLTPAHGTRILTARSQALHSDAHHHTTTAHDGGRRSAIHYLPTFRSTWFRHRGTIFLVRRVCSSASGSSSRSYTPRIQQNTYDEPGEFASAADGADPLVVMCLGRSVEPIKRFLEDCRRFGEAEREDFVTVRISRAGGYQLWGTTVLRQLRPLETVHFDERVKAELVADVRNYLDPATRRFYSRRGIPYRRGEFSRASSC